MGGLCVDLAASRTFVDDHEIYLTPTEYRLLTTLIRNVGKIVTHRQLIQEVWGPGSVEENQYLSVYLGRLRRRLEIDPARSRYALIEPGVGYRLADE